MSKLKLVWIGFLMALYASFWFWYGGNGTPITASEGEEMLARLSEVHGNSIDEALPGSLPKNLQEMIPNDDGKEFYAVNLETLKKGAVAKESDRKYAKIVFPLLFERAGHPVFISDRAGLMLGEYGNNIDRVAVVRYRSLRDMIDMAADPAMKAGSKFKYGALEHTEVFITRPTITAVQIRLIVALLLVTICIAGLKLIDWRRGRR